MFLFLDFDGVLHRYGCKPTDLLCRLPLLEAWLLERENVEVVISSTWRESRSTDALRALFSPALRHRIIGVTPKLDGALPERFPREAEINLWLRESGQAWRPWAALDDQAWLFRPFNDRLVLCDPDVGLTEVELERLSALDDLGARQRSYPRPVGP